MLDRAVLTRVVVLGWSMDLPEIWMRSPVEQLDHILPGLHAGVVGSGESNVIPGLPAVLRRPDTLPTYTHPSSYHTPAVWRG